MAFFEQFKFCPLLRAAFVDFIVYEIMPNMDFDDTAEFMRDIAESVSENLKISLNFQNFRLQQNFPIVDHPQKEPKKK